MKIFDFTNLYGTVCESYVLLLFLVVYMNNILSFYRNMHIIYNLANILIHHYRCQLIILDLSSFILYFEYIMIFCHL